jgi:hypothetical protein
MTKKTRRKRGLTQRWKTTNNFHSPKRDLLAKEVLDRSGPYKPKIIPARKLHNDAHESFDDWYFDLDRGFYEEEDSDD